MEQCVEERGCRRDTNFFETASNVTPPSSMSSARAPRAHASAACAAPACCCYHHEHNAHLPGGAPLPHSLISSRSWHGVSRYRCLSWACVTREAFPDEAHMTILHRYSPGSIVEMIEIDTTVSRSRPVRGANAKRTACARARACVWHDVFTLRFIATSNLIELRCHHIV